MKKIFLFLFSFVLFSAVIAQDDYDYPINKYTRQKDMVLKVKVSGDTLLIGKYKFIATGGSSIDSTLIAYLAKKNVFTVKNTFKDTLQTVLISDTAGNKAISINNEVTIHKTLNPVSDLGITLGTWDKRFNIFHSRNITDTTGGMRLLRMKQGYGLSSWDYAGTATVNMMWLDSVNIINIGTMYVKPVGTFPNPGQILLYNASITAAGGAGDTTSFSFGINGTRYWRVWGVNDGSGAVSISGINIKGLLFADSIYTLKAAAWADYVFDDDYYLMQFDEAIQYIKINKHLPALKPRNDNKYISSIEQQRRFEGLVEEVEKLYLYIDELKKEIELLKNQ